MPEEACEEAVRDIDKSSAQPSPEEQLESLRREEAKIEEERELQVRAARSNLRSNLPLCPAATPPTARAHTLTSPPLSPPLLQASKIVDVVPDDPKELREEAKTRPTRAGDAPPLCHHCCHRHHTTSPPHHHHASSTRADSIGAAEAAESLARQGGRAGGRSAAEAAAASAAAAAEEAAAALAAAEARADGAMADGSLEAAAEQQHAERLSVEQLHDIAEAVRETLRTRDWTGRMEATITTLTSSLLSHPFRWRPCRRTRRSSTSAKTWRRWRWRR